MSFFKKHWKLLVPSFLILIAIVIVAANSVPHLYQKWTLDNKTCGNPVLTTAPIDGNDYGYLIPLGNLGPPDHTIPSDHIYYVFNRTDQNAPPPKTDVHAPADVTITQISYTETTKNGALYNTDYKINFSPCGKVDVYYDHIHYLAPKLASIFGNKSGCQTHQSAPGQTETYCNKSVNIPMKAGELIGQAGGGLAAGFDFGANDSRGKPLAYVNQSRYGSPQYSICPFDLYSSNMKTDLEKNFQTKGEPICGTVMQDKAGTLQGNWFFGKGVANTPERWMDDLALVHYNYDPTIGALSVGGIVGNAELLLFHPQTSGNTNREFSEVSPGNTIYCYHGDFQSQNQEGLSSSQYLVQLTTGDKLKIERQTGNCSGNLSFSNPTTYER